MVNLIRIIKTGQSALGWDDETYRAVLARLTQKTSAKDLADWEKEKVIAFMRESGFKPSKKHGRKPSVAQSRKALLSKIEAILAKYNLTWNYAASISERMFKQKVIEWLTTEELHKLLKALIYYNNRRQ